MTIHTFGDSHADKGWNTISRVNIHPIGAVLCYSFGNEKLNRLNIKTFNVVNNDTVIFCFGEIDCRCHIQKHISLENTYESIINNIVDNYFNAIKDNVSQFNQLRTCVYNVVPPIKKCNTPENKEYPYLGTDEERKNYVLYFNKKLKENCLKYNYTFFNVYDKYIDENGFLSKQLSDGNVHIENGIFLKEFIMSENI